MMEGGGGCEAKAGTEGTPLQAADSQTAGHGETVFQAGHGQRHLEESSCDHFHETSGEQSSLVGEEGGSGEPLFRWKAPGPHFSHSYVSALHLHTLVGSHGQEVTTKASLLVLVPCVVFIIAVAKHLPETNNQSEERLILVQF